jgi:hypothetical protein
MWALELSSTNQIKYTRYHHSLVDDKDYSLENAASSRNTSYLVAGVILKQIIAMWMKNSTAASSINNLVLAVTLGCPITNQRCSRQASVPVYVQ